jgi:hypothetical protein
VLATKKRVINQLLQLENRGQKNFKVC